MADLDTRSKRASSVNILRPYAAALVLPDATISAGDRQHIAWAYSGILAAAAAGTYSLAWLLDADFNLDGTFETDLQPYIAEFAGGLDVRRGLNEQRVYQVSTLALSLDNGSGTFTPELSSSSLFGKIFPELPIRLRATFGPTTYPLWQGYVTDWDYEFLPGPQNTAQVSAEDLMGLLGRIRDLSATASTTRRSDQAISTLLTNVGLAAGDYNLATGVQTLNIHYAAGDEATAAIMEAVRAEMGGLLWVSADGKITFEARNTRLGTTIDDTWGDGTDIVPAAERYHSGMDALITGVTLEVTPITADPAGKSVSGWSRGSGSGAQGGQDNSIEIAPGQTYTVRVKYRSPASSVTPPVATTDYKGNAAADGSGADRTSNLNVTFADFGGEYEAQIRNDHAATVYLTKWGVRGTGRHQAASDATPVFRYSLPIPLLKLDVTTDLRLSYIDDSPTTAPKAQDYAYHLMRLGRWPAPRIGLTVAWKNQATVTAMLNAEIGDLVDYSSAALGADGSSVDDLYYIDAIAHSIPPSSMPSGAGIESEITLLPAWAYRNLDKIIYDTFNRANGALTKTDNGKTWLTVGNVAIAGSVAKSSTTAVQTPNIDLTAADLVTEVSLGALNTLEATGRIGLIYRYTDASNYWRIYVDNSTDKLALEKVVAGVATIVAQPAYTILTTAELRVIVQGNRHRVWVRDATTPAGKRYIDVVDAALNTATKVGLYCLNTSLATWDNYFSEALS